MGAAGGFADEEAEEVARGRRAERPREIPARGWRDILWRLWDKVWADRAMLVAGGVTFYLLLALFPALAAFVSLFGLFADRGSIAGQVGFLSDVLPAAGFEIVLRQLTELAGQQTGTLGFGLAVSLAFALWTANNGVKAIFEALNIAYGEQETRSLLTLHLVSFAFTLGGLALAVLLLTVVGLVPAVLPFLELGGFTEFAIRVLRWVILMPVIAVVLALFYRFGPSRRPAQWRWVSWGSMLAATVWLVTSIGYSWYLENFGNYNAMYGSLGALIGLLLWMWLSALILIVGAELNAEMEHQTRHDTTDPPEKPMGERGAYMADTLGRPVD